MKSLSPRMHWEKVKNRQACIEYCTKGDVVVSHIATNKRPRIELAVECLRHGGLPAVAQEYPDQMVLHYRGYLALSEMQLA